jgi:hypothetical protein
MSMKKNADNFSKKFDDFFKGSVSKPVERRNFLWSAELFSFSFFAQFMKNYSIKCLKSKLCDTIKCLSLVECLNVKYDSSFNPSNFIKRIRGEESTSEM